jgi:hypothetical protein
VLSLSRRDLAFVVTLFPRWVRALGNSSRFQLGLVKHRGVWDSRLSALRRLAFELGARTSVEVNLEVLPLSLDSPSLFDAPFLVLTGEGELPPFSSTEIESLRRYLTYGGCLFADASDASDGSGFDVGFRREMSRVFPQNLLQKLPAKHVLFKTFFLLDTAPGRVLNKPFVEAILVQKRATVLYSQNDVLGALSRDASGAFEFEPTPGGSRQREMATRLALNVAMYALCLDYKDDAVHLPLIMNRRR